MLSTVECHWRKVIARKSEPRLARELAEAIEIDPLYGNLICELHHDEVVKIGLKNINLLPVIQDKNLRDKFLFAIKNNDIRF